MQEHLLSDLYDAVGIRAGGRPTATSRRDTPGTENGEGSEGRIGGPKREGEETAVVSGNGDAPPSKEEFGEYIGTASTREENGAAGASGAEEEEFFFPVTPEQLIMLNFTEIAAGKRKYYK